MLLRKGDRNDNVKKLQKGLNALGHNSGRPDGIFGNGTEDAVEDFQERNDLYPDGIFGPASMEKYDAALLAAGHGDLAFQPPPSKTIDPVEPDDGLMDWVRVPADKYGNGFDCFQLREDVAEIYRGIYDYVHERGGLITSSGARRPLVTSAGAGMSRKSFHYVGRALDLNIYSGMQDPVDDPYIVVKVGDTRRWEVWAKVRNNHVQAPKAHEVEVVTLEACTWKDGKLRFTKWTGKAINLTKLFMGAGFSRIRGRKSFFTGGAYIGAEHWHFQYTADLVKGENTFGEELLKVYSLEEAKQFVYWEESKDAAYNVSWW